MECVVIESGIAGRRMSIASKLLMCVLVLFVKSAMGQNECATNFKVNGDPRNGAAYVTYITIPRIDIHSALGQVEKIAIDGGFVPGAESYEGNVGSLTFVRKDKSGLLHQNKGFPILVKADKSNNRLIMALQLNQGQISTADNMQNFMCTILTHVTMDSAGADAAAAAHAETHSDEITNITALELAQKLTRRAWGRSFKPGDLENEYVGRVYRLDGRVVITDPLSAYTRAIKVQEGNPSIDVAYDTSKVKTGLLGNSGLGGVPGMLGEVICHSDPKQLDRFAALRSGDYATVIGKVVQVIATKNSATLYLDCHFEK
jgi:hypothetical protein